MHGSSYIWGFLVPASFLLFAGFYLSAQLNGAVKLTAALQVDQRARNKIIKRRGLQVGLFFKVRLKLFFIAYGSEPCPATRSRHLRAEAKSLLQLKISNLLSLPPPLFYLVLLIFK
jgi:hypothetical protein